MTTMENRQDFWMKHWQEVQKPALTRSGLMSRNLTHPGLVSHNVFGKGWGKPIEEKWDVLINEGKSPKELWQTRYQELTEINGKFEKVKVNTEKTEEEEGHFRCFKKDSEEMRNTFEHVGLLFMKPNMQDMQERWETQMNEGKTPEEFWKEERPNLSGRGRFWGWGRHDNGRSRFNKEGMCQGRRRGKNEDSALFQEFDF